jgi:hypothetical protein
MRVQIKPKSANSQTPADTKTAVHASAQENRLDTNTSARSVQANAKTQRARILGILVAARGQWVPLPDILVLGIAQYGARILELRRLGFNIENKTERLAGARRSWFRLASSPEWKGEAAGKA